MDSRQYEQKIEQLIVELSGMKGLLNEIVTLTNLFMPLLRQHPQVDKRMLANLEKRLQVVQMMFDMERQAPPHIVQSSF